MPAVESQLWPPCPLTERTYQGQALPLCVLVRLVHSSRRMKRLVCRLSARDQLHLMTR